MLANLNRDAVQQALSKVKTVTTNAEKKHRGVQATKVLKLLSSICEWCMDQEWIDRNPCRGIEKPVPIAHPMGKQHRPPTNSELRQLWNDGPEVMSPAKTRVLRLAILIGRRISEIAGASRGDTKLDAGIPCLFIPGERVGNKPKRDDAVPLPPSDLRSRTLHHTVLLTALNLLASGDLQQLANTVYSAYDFLPERLRALQLWEARLLEIVEARKPANLRW